MSPPGPDGLPAEFYKANSDLLVPKFYGLLLKMLREGCPPPSMSEAVIVVIAKPNKDPIKILRLVPRTAPSRF